MPIYQTLDDLARENAIADTLESAWRCTIVKHRGPMDAVDRLAYRAGKVVAVIEIKTRRVALLSYPFALIDVAKATALSMTAMEYGSCRALEVIQYDDGLFYVDIDADGVRRCRIAKPTGRTDRGPDVEHACEVYQVPVDRMRRVAPPQAPETAEEPEQNVIPETSSARERVLRIEQQNDLWAQDGTFDRLADLGKEIKW